MQVMAVKPMRGSLAGGHLVQISGSGMSSQASEMSVNIGGAPCSVLESSPSSIACTTSAARAPGLSTIAVTSIQQPATALQIAAQGSVQHGLYPARKTHIARVSSIGIATYLTEHNAKKDWVPCFFSSWDDDDFFNRRRLIVAPAASLQSPSRSLSCGNFVGGSVSASLFDPVRGHINRTVTVGGLFEAQQVTELLDLVTNATAAHILILHTYEVTRYNSMHAAPLFTALQDHCGGSDMVPNVRGTNDDNGASGRSRPWLFVGRCHAGLSTGWSRSVGLEVIGESKTDHVLIRFQLSKHFTVSAGLNPVHLAQAYNYDPSITPVVRTINRLNGTTAGGTTIILTGRNLHKLLGNRADASRHLHTHVTLAGRTCALRYEEIGTYQGKHLCEWPAVNCSGLGVDPSGSRARCLANAHSYTSGGAVRVHVPGRGVAQILPSVTYDYLDSWSSKTTWGGNDPPAVGSYAAIPTGQIVLLDVSPPPLALVTIQGKLVFSDHQDLALNASYIIINRGTMQAGTPAEPHLHKVVITLVGNRLSPEVPTFGAKCLGVRHGVLDMHGRPATSWTRLAQTARRGAMDLDLQEAVTGWRRGDQIIVTSTEFDQEETEAMTVYSVQGKRVYLTEPLKYDHYGDGWDQFGRRMDHYRAEVGLISRSIVIQGDEQSKTSQFGAQIVFSNGKATGAADDLEARLSNVEVRRGGQALKLGKYPIHFHMAGDLRKSFVRNCSIADSFNRALAIHGVNHLRVQENVVYNTRGHAVFIEDGTEMFNVIEGNLGALVRPVASLLAVDQSPSVFWIVNPHNTFRRNVAAGSSHYGIWLRPLPHPDGISGAALEHEKRCPDHTPLAAFEGNVAHSTGKHGVKISNYFPTLQGYTCMGSRGKRFERTFSVPAVIKDQTCFKNSQFGVWGEFLVDVHFDGLAVADTGMASWEFGWVNGNDNDDSSSGESTQSGVGALASPDEFAISRIMNSIFVGHVFGQDRGRFSRGPHLPGLSGGVRISNTTFHDLGNAIVAGALSDSLRGGYSFDFEKVAFFNCENKTLFTHASSAILNDLDGTLTGVLGLGGSFSRGKKHAQIVPYSRLLLGHPDCNIDVGPGATCARYNPLAINRHGDIGLPCALLCHPRAKVRRIAIDGTVASTFYNTKGPNKLYPSLQVTDRGSGASSEDFDHPGALFKGPISCVEQSPKNGWLFLGTVGAHYEMRFRDQKGARVSIVPTRVQVRHMKPDEAIIFKWYFNAPHLHNDGKSQFSRGTPQRATVHRLSLAEGKWAVQGPQLGWGVKPTLPKYGVGAADGQLCASFAPCAGGTAWPGPQLRYKPFWIGRDMAPPVFLQDQRNSGLAASKTAVSMLDTGNASAGGRVDLIAVQSFSLPVHGSFFFNSYDCAASSGGCADGCAPGLLQCSELSIVAAGNTTLQSTVHECPLDGCAPPQADEIQAEYEHVKRSGASGVARFRWSDAVAWWKLNLTKPVDDDDVVIYPGMEVLLDESTPKLNSLRILGRASAPNEAGKLIFDDSVKQGQPLVLRTAAIDVAGGLLQIGNATHPFSRRQAVVVLHGDRYVAHELGSLYKTIDVRGRFVVHGRPVASVMRLAEDAPRGSITLKLADPLKCDRSCPSLPASGLGWRPGDRLVLTGSDHFGTPEFVIIKSVAHDGRTVILSAPLRGYFLGGTAGSAHTRVQGGHELDQRASVGFLSHTVEIIGGDEDVHGDMDSGLTSDEQAFGFLITGRSTIEARPGWLPNMRGFAENGVDNFNGAIDMRFVTMLNSGRRSVVLGNNFNPMVNAYKDHALTLASGTASATFRGLAVLRPHAPRFLDTNWQGSLDFHGNVLVDSAQYFDAKLPFVENNLFISTSLLNSRDTAPVAVSTYSQYPRVQADLLVGRSATLLPTRTRSGQLALRLFAHPLADSFMGGTGAIRFGTTNGRVHAIGNRITGVVQHAAVQVRAFECASVAAREQVIWADNIVSSSQIGFYLKGPEKQGTEVSACDIVQLAPWKNGIGVVIGSGVKRASNIIAAENAVGVIHGDFCMPPECTGPEARGDFGIALEFTVVSNSSFVNRIAGNAYPGLDCASCGSGSGKYPCEDISERNGLRLGDAQTGAVFLTDFTSTAIQYAGAGSLMGDFVNGPGLQGSGWRHWLEIEDCSFDGYKGRDGPAWGVGSSTHVGNECGWTAAAIGNELAIVGSGSKSGEDLDFTFGRPHCYPVHVRRLTFSNTPPEARIAFSSRFGLKATCSVVDEDGSVSGFDGHSWIEGNNGPVVIYSPHASSWPDTMLDSCAAKTPKEQCPWWLRADCGVADGMCAATSRAPLQGLGFSAAAPTFEGVQAHCHAYGDGGDLISRGLPSAVKRGPWPAGERRTLVAVHCKHMERVAIRNHWPLRLVSGSKLLHGPIGVSFVDKNGVLSSPAHTTVLPAIPSEPCGLTIRKRQCEPAPPSGDEQYNDPSVISVPNGGRYRINYTGDPPEEMSFDLLSATAKHTRGTFGDDWAVVLEVRFPGPERINVYVNGKVVLPSASKSAVTLASLPGANHIGHDRVLSFLVRGADRVQLRAVPVVQVGLVVAVPIDDFFAESFVSNMAAVLGINPARVRVVSIVPGNGRRRLLDDSRRLSATSVVTEIAEDDVCANVACGRHGECTAATGSCKCDAGWGGSSCDAEVVVAKAVTPPTPTPSPVVLFPTPPPSREWAAGVTFAPTAAPTSLPTAAPTIAPTKSPTTTKSGEIQRLAFNELVDVANKLQDKAATGQLETGYDITGAAVTVPRDACGVEAGDGSSCMDGCGVINGDNATCADACGVPNGDGSSCVDTVERSAHVLTSSWDWTDGTVAGQRHAFGVRVGARQLIRLSGNLAGTFTIEFNGEHTKPLSQQATSSAIKEAVELLPTVGSVAVGRQRNASGLYFVVAFTGRSPPHNAGPLPLLRVDALGLVAAQADVLAVYDGRNAPGYVYEEQLVTLPVYEAVDGNATSGMFGLNVSTGVSTGTGSVLAVDASADAVRSSLQVLLGTARSVEVFAEFVQGVMQPTVRFGTANASMTTKAAYATSTRRWRVRFYSRRDGQTDDIAQMAADRRALMPPATLLVIETVANGSKPSRVSPESVITTAASSLNVTQTPIRVEVTAIKQQCGDGVRTRSEACDDNNTMSGDGCSANCRVETRYNCSAALGTRSTCVPTCGDGVMDPPETCDDGNSISGDGCSASCFRETAAPTRSPTPTPTSAPTAPPTPKSIPTPAPTRSPTRAPTPFLRNVVDSRVRLPGLTLASFNARVFKQAMAKQAHTTEDRIDIVKIVGARRYRRLSGVEAVEVKFRIKAVSQRGAAALVSTLQTMYAKPKDFVETLSAGLAAAGQAVPESLALVSVDPPVATDLGTLSPTPAAPAPPPTLAPTEMPTKAAVAVRLEVFGLPIYTFQQSVPQITRLLAALYAVLPAAVLIGNIEAGSRILNATSSDLPWEIAPRRRLLARRTHFVQLDYYVRVAGLDDARRAAAYTTQPRLLLVIMRATKQYAVDVRVALPPRAVVLPRLWNPTPLPTRAPSPSAGGAGSKLLYAHKSASSTSMGLVVGFGLGALLLGLAALNRKFRAGIETAKAFSDVDKPDPTPTVVVARPTHVVQTIDGGFIAIDPTTSVHLGSAHIGGRGQVLPINSVNNKSSSL
jgi:cysteine-rich repeat protein